MHVGGIGILHMLVKCVIPEEVGRDYEDKVGVRVLVQFVADGYELLLCSCDRCFGGGWARP
jgi:hypothetical protein